MKLNLVGLGLAITMLSSAAFGATVSVGVSGKGAVNDSTVIAGEPFSVDIFVANDSTQRGFTIGFKLKSDNIKSVVHVADSGKGLSSKGDVKGHNGWQDSSIWDLKGIFVVESNWDGNLPDTIGFGGVCVNKQYSPHEKLKCLSMDLIVPTEGAFVIDSSFWPPSGIWIFAGENQTARVPKWGGARKIKVVGKAAASDMPAVKDTTAKEDKK